MFQSTISFKILNHFHWLHCFVFFPLCVFKYALKLSAREEAKSHWLHLFGLFSTVCFHMCPQRACLNRGVVTLVAFAFVTNAIIKALQQMNTLNRNVYSTASSRSYVETITDNFLKR